MTTVSTTRRQGVNSSAAIKVPCALATTANITLSGEQSIDGTTTSSSRVLVKNQTDGVSNGIYNSSTSAWTRAPDFDGAYDVVKGTLIHVLGGTVNGGFYYEVTTSDPIVIGTTSLSFQTSTLQSGISSASTSTAITLYANQHVVIGTGADVTGGAKFQTPDGITFPVTQVSSTNANTLDDYEEGTFTPTIIGATTAGAGTYSNQIGHYTKIGNKVHVQIYLNWSAHTGTGNMQIGILPFATKNITNLYASATLGYVNLVALTAGYVPMAWANAGETVIRLYQIPTGGGINIVVPLDVSAEMMITIDYLTD